MKTFTIEFYQGDVGNQDLNLSDLLNEIANNNNVQAVNQNGTGYEPRSLQVINNGNVVKGYFAKFRNDNLPHVGELGGNERELELAADEGLMEKNYFHYSRQHELLIWQANGHGSTAQRFANYLSEVTNEVVSFLPVLQHNAMQRMMNGHAQVRNLDMRVAMSPVAGLVPETDFSRGVMASLAHARGKSMHIEVRGDGRSHEPESRYLSNQVKNGIQDLMRVADVQSARIDVEEDGTPLPAIDLITDRLKSKQNVEMLGRYPDEAGIYTALDRARVEQMETIQAILGN